MTIGPTAAFGMFERSAAVNVKNFKLVQLNNLPSNNSNPVKSAIIFTILGFMGPALSFFLLPIYLKYLTPEDYGILSLMMILGTFINILASLQLGAAFRTYYFDYNDDPPLLKKYLQNIYSATLLLSIGFMILFVLIGPSFFSFIFKDERITFFPFGFLTVANTIFSLTTSIYLVFLKNGIRLKDFARYSIASLILTVSFQYYFIVIKQLGAVGSLLGSCISSFIIFSVVFISNFDLVRFHFDKKMIRNSLSYGLPVIPFLILNWFTIRGDRFFIEQFLSLETVGQYALLITIIGLLPLVMGAIENSIRPFLFEAFKQKDEKFREINNYILFYIVVCLLASSGIVLIGNNLRFITSNPNYLYVIPYFTLAAFTVFLRAYIRLFNEQLSFVKRSKDVTYLSIISFVILIVAYLKLVPAWEIWGALSAILIANLLSAFIFHYQAQKRFSLKHSYKNLVFIPFLIFASIVGVQILCKNLNLPDMVFGLLQFAVVVVLLYALTFKQLKKLSIRKK